MALIRPEHLEELLALRGKGGPVVSLYLNVTPPRPFKSELRSPISRKWEKLQEAAKKAIPTPPLRKSKSGG